MKKVAVIIAVILILLLGLALAKNLIARAALAAGVKAITGLELQTESISVLAFRTAAGVHGLKILNPAGFSDKVMAELPEIYVDYDLGAFFKGKIHLEELRLNLKELVVVKNSNGQLNINSLKALLPKKDKAEKIPEIRIDMLAFKIGKVVYKDYTAAEPSVREFSLNIDERLHDVTDHKTLVRLILARALLKTGIAGLVNVDLSLLGREATRAAHDVKTLITDTAQQVGDSAAGLGETAVDTIKKAGEDVRKLLKLGQ